MTKEEIENDKIKEIAEQAVNDTIDEIAEQALNYAQPKLTKKNIFFEIKTMFLQLFSWFIYIVIGLFLMNIVYDLPIGSRVNNASLELIKTLDIILIIKNYLTLGINFLLVFALFSYIYSKFVSKSYEESRKKIIELRIIIYVLFIGLFSLQSFTVEQLDLVLLINSLILLFEFVFKRNDSFSEKEFRNLARNKILKDWNQELEEKEKRTKDEKC